MTTTTQETKAAHSAQNISGNTAHQITPVTRTTVSLDQMVHALKRGHAAPGLPAGSLLIFESSYGGRHEEGEAGLAHSLDPTASVTRSRHIDAVLRSSPPPGTPGHALARRGAWAVLGQHRGRMKGTQGNGYALLTHVPEHSRTISNIALAEITDQIKRLSGAIQARPVPFAVLDMPHLDRRLREQGHDPDEVWGAFAASLGHARRYAHFIQVQYPTGNAPNAPQTGQDAAADKQAPHPAEETQR